MTRVLIIEPGYCPYQAAFDSPQAAISVRGHFFESILQNGAFANFTALNLSSELSWFSPQPSLITNITGLFTPFIS